MFALKTLIDLCTTQSSKLIYISINILHILSFLVLQQSIRTAKIFKPNLLIPKYRTIKVQDGQWVEKDTVLTLQNNLVLYPGENVIINKKFIFIFFLFDRHLLLMIIQFDRKYPVLL